MSNGVRQRRLKGLETEQEAAIASMPGPDVVLRELEREQAPRRKACLALLDFAFALIGPVERPQFEPEPPPAPPSPFAPADPGEFAHLARPLAPRERKPWYDPSFGGRMMGAYGGWGTSAEAHRHIPWTEPPPPRQAPRGVPGANPWGMQVPSYATEEQKSEARKWGWLPPEELPEGSRGEKSAYPNMFEPDKKKE